MATEDERYIMKYLMMLWLVIFPCALSGVHSEEAFLQANEFYKKEEYEKAIKLYDEVKNPGFAVLYNTALSYMQQKKYAYAKLALLQAERCANFKKLGQKQELYDAINAKIGMGKSTSWLVPMEIFIKKCILSLSIFGVQLVLLLILLLLVSVVYIRLYRQYVGLFIIMIIMLCTVFGVWQYKMKYMKQQVGVIVQETNLLAGPAATFYAKHPVAKGSVGKVLAKRDTFYQISQGSKIGWVDAESIKLIS